jgi:hypothetical protein
MPKQFQTTGALIELESWAGAENTGVVILDITIQTCHLLRKAAQVSATAVEPATGTDRAPGFNTVVHALAADYLTSKVCRSVNIVSIYATVGAYIPRGTDFAGSSDSATSCDVIGSLYVVKFNDRWHCIPPVFSRYTSSSSVSSPALFTG